MKSVHTEALPKCAQVGTCAETHRYRHASEWPQATAPVTGYGMMRSNDGGMERRLRAAGTLRQHHAKRGRTEAAAVAADCAASGRAALARRAAADRASSQCRPACEQLFQPIGPARGVVCPNRVGRKTAARHAAH